MKTESRLVDILADASRRLRQQSVWSGSGGVCDIRCSPLSGAELESTHAQQVVGGPGEVRLQLYAGGSDEACLAKTAIGLQLAEDLLDPFALSLADPVTLMARRAIVQSRRAPAFNPRNVRADASIAQSLDEGAAVIALVTAQALRTHTLATLSVQKRRRRNGLGDDCRRAMSSLTSRSRSRENAD